MKQIIKEMKEAANRLHQAFLNDADVDTKLALCKELQELFFLEKLGQDNDDDIG